MNFDEDLLEALRKQIEAMMGGTPVDNKDGVVRISIVMTAPVEFSDDLVDLIVHDMRDEIDTMAWLQQSWDMPAYEKPTN